MNIFSQILIQPALGIYKVMMIKWCNSLSFPIPKYWINSNVVRVASCYFFKFWVSHNFVIPKVPFSEFILNPTSVRLKPSRVWLIFWPESVRNSLVTTPMCISLTSGCYAFHYHYGVKFQKLWQNIYIIYIL